MRAVRSLLLPVAIAALSGFTAPRRALAEPSSPPAAVSGGALPAATPEPVEKPRDLELSGYIQADAVVFRQRSQDEIDGSTGEPLNEDRFLVRRGRLQAAGKGGVLGADLEFDANTVEGPNLRLVRAEVSASLRAERWLHRPFVSASLGLMKIPFGWEIAEEETARLFLERSTVMRALFPGNYDVGARLGAGFGPLRASLAAMNGEPAGERSFPAQDPNAAKDLVGRIGVDVELGQGARAAGGVSALSGTGLHPGTPSTKDVLVWRDVNENGLVEPTEIQAIAGNAATSAENFDRFALGADARLSARLPVIGELVVYGELVFAKNLDRGLEPADPVGAGRDLRELGWYLAFSQELTQWAMVGARYDRYDPDADATDQRGARLVPFDRSYSTLALAAALRLAPGRLVFEYDHNTNPLGRTQGGLPTTLADDAFTIRAEVIF